MNQKKAKLLRKLAKNMLKKVQDEHSAHTVEAQYIEDEKNRKIQTIYKTDKTTGNFIFDKTGFPIVEKRVLIADGTMRLTDDCLKGIYNNLKKNV